jgi:hypothetical protein
MGREMQVLGGTYTIYQIIAQLNHKKLAFCLVFYIVHVV